MKKLMFTGYSLFCASVPKNTKQRSIVKVELARPLH